MFLFIPEYLHSMKNIFILAYENIILDNELSKSFTGYFYQCATNSVIVSNKKSGLQ